MKLYSSDAASTTTISSYIIDSHHVYDNTQTWNNHIYGECVTKDSHSEEDRPKARNGIKSNDIWQEVNYYTDCCKPIKIVYEPEPIKTGNELEFDLPFELISLPFELISKNNKAALPCLNNLNAKYFYKRIDRGKITFPFKSTVLLRNSRFVGFLSMLDNIRFYFSEDPSGNSMLLKHNGQVLFTPEEFFDVLKSRKYTIE